MGITTELADFVSDTSLDDIPADVVERVKIYFLHAPATGYVATSPRRALR